jgi:hypothetical protein
MKFFTALVLGCAMFIGSADQASAQCCDKPVRQAVKATVCMPVRVARAWRQVQPVRRVASLPFRVTKRWAEVKPVRSTLKRVACGFR